MTRHTAIKVLDNVKRKFFIKNSIKKLFFTFSKNKNCSFLEKELIAFKLVKTKLIGNRSRINNRCIETGRNYNIVSKFGYSRFIFRKNAKLNQLSSVRKV